MKILFYSDTHIRDTGSFSYFNRIQEDGLTLEAKNKISGFEFVKDKIVEFEPDCVIHLGDMYQAIDHISAMTLHVADLCLTKIADLCQKMGISHLYVVGNHDILSENHKIYSTSPLRKYFDSVFDDVHILNKKDLKIGIIPYRSSSDQLKNDLANISSVLSDSDLLITHNEFHGAYYDNFHPSSIDVSPKFRCSVISGHLHLRHSIHSVHYVGALVQDKFLLPHIKNVGGVLIYDTNADLKIECYPNFYSRHYVKITELSQLKELSPERVVLSVSLPVREEEISAYLKDFSYVYHYIPPLKEDVHFEHVHVVKPIDFLKNHILENNPDAISVFEELCV